MAMGHKSSGIAQFLTDVKDRGLAKKNKFVMLIPTPHGMTPPNGTSDSAHWSKFSIESTEIPGFSIQTQDNYIYHFSQKMPYMASYDDISIVVRCDAQYSERKFFDAWKGLIKKHSTGNVRYKTDYAVDIQIEQLADDGSVIHGVVLFNAFPIMVASLDLQSSEADIHHMSVSFAYDRYVSYADLEG